jgi:dextranase
MNVAVTIAEIRRDKAFYLPGDQVGLSVLLKSNVERSIPLNMVVEIRHLNSLVDQIEKTFTHTGPEQEVEVHYTPPPDSPRGYGIDICIEANSKSIVVNASSAFDVLDHWTQTPRYGFLTDFFPGRSNHTETMESLIRYQINGLQFYDWMYRHDQFLVEDDPYRDPLGRLLSLETVNKLISASHEHNIAAMPYTAIYASSIPFYEEHMSWALFKANGEPFLLGEDFLVYMDPRPDSPWVSHLLEQFNQVLSETEFDGIHLDQYGDPKDGYDYKGNRFNLAEPIAETINRTKELVLSHRQGGAVVFNAVTNWPIETVAPANQDFSYIEVWPPFTWFTDLHHLIIQAQQFGNGKPVVLAAYVDPSFEYNVRLVDATIFASGGGHIELGEIGSMLSHEYFPRYKAMSDELANTMQKYYDFAVRYQDVIGPRTIDKTQDYHHRIEVEGAYTGPDLRTNKVWPIVRESDNYLGINLINLSDVASPEWAEPLTTPPTVLGPTDVTVYYIDKDISEVWVASPDNDVISPSTLEFEFIKEGGRNAITFEIPSLAYWYLIILEWGR